MGQIRGEATITAILVERKVLNETNNELLAATFPLNFGIL